MAWTCCCCCLFCSFTSQVNSFGHGKTVSSPNHTFSWASLNKHLTSTSCTYFTTALLEWFSRREENDRRNSQWKYGTGQGVNSRPPDLQSDLHLLPYMLPTALRGPFFFLLLLLFVWLYKGKHCGHEWAFCQFLFAKMLYTQMISDIQKFASWFYFV